MNRFQFVEDRQRRHGVKRLCGVLGLSRSSFYYWRRTAAARAARQTVETGLARFAVRWERRTELHNAVVSLACSLICWRRLKKTRA